MQRLIEIDRAAGLLSFNNLAEAYVLASLTRRFELPMQRVRNALRFVGGVRPLLTTPFQTDGRGIFVEQFGKLIDATQGGQGAICEVVENSLQRVDVDEKQLPLRIYPWRREPTEPRIIALDPRRAFGKPTVVGSSVQSETIIDRHRAGDSVARLAADYGLSGDVIEGVLRWPRRPPDSFVYYLDANLDGPDLVKSAREGMYGLVAAAHLAMKKPRPQLSPVTWADAVAPRQLGGVFGLRPHGRRPACGGRSGLVTDGRNGAITVRV